MSIGLEGDVGNVFHLVSDEGKVLGGQTGHNHFGLPRLVRFGFHIGSVGEDFQTAFGFVRDFPEFDRTVRVFDLAFREYLGNVFSLSVKKGFAAYID